jgi:hypothetical protein
MMEMVVDIDYLPDTKLLVTFRPCPSCGKNHQLTVGQHAFKNYMNGDKNVLDAFPELLPAEHELFLTAIDGDCWKTMFKEEGTECLVSR